MRDNRNDAARFTSGRCTALHDESAPVFRGTFETHRSQSLMTHMSNDALLARCLVFSGCGVSGLFIFNTCSQRCRETLYGVGNTAEARTVLYFSLIPILD